MIISVHNVLINHFRFCLKGLQFVYIFLIVKTQLNAICVKNILLITTD